METVVYFVRHADSAFVEGQERERGLSEQGARDAKIIKELLQDEPLDVFVSSPYVRSVETIQELADWKGKPIEQFEDLRERNIGQFAPMSFADAKRKVYEEPQFAFPEGESSLEAADRAAQALLSLLVQYEGLTLLLGTHGDIMTLMLQTFDPRYGFEFWRSTTMPDIYRVHFDGTALKQVSRIMGGVEA
ncbi:histidine phosphatase family protein [Paenibacillus vini]|uniref:Phosphoglycerate mutase n=1 Tax=Paenibacillus vini TaxID=1476024 RepID=A0ABQ4MBM0_9BACL|nr:histidine phosphatase family protein [Paenibacillus vini]GIP53385.1 phosphoglycerate mutase [Paenibacillus vini]